ncbi:hypothetical protein M422DRAFT_265272 [Sphaerobolus stellatus SS14]|uniref:Ubiquitin-like protease family profile domain-containing protein n=1 Tax=Sphaerobolus stellatus (strain SS14) TaxID=990650 RepID=A0A0C9V6H6_SPHS4|nr:hypothetical protein M422DRAFT_265272 [Sphaerobolus stellatus SS14]
MAQVPKQDNDFDCGPFMIHNVGRLSRSFRNIVNFLKDPLSTPTLEASTIWEPMYAPAKRPELEVLARRLLAQCPA